MDRKEYSRRLQFEHELVNRRVTWLLTLQTILLPHMVSRSTSRMHYSGKPSQSPEQAILAATHQSIDWAGLQVWFANEGEPDDAFERFRAVVRSRK